MRQWINSSSFMEFEGNSIKNNIGDQRYLFFRHILILLTHCRRYKIPDDLQTMFPNAFWWEDFRILFKYHRNSF